MIEGHARSATVYWTQLTLAMGIATLGLVLDSTGVVIGAMLVSPLMNPIVALGMGLAVGSPMIAFRSFLRVVASVAWVIAGAMAITACLPFHEATREILARTAPTALDLLVAGFCALAGAFITVRPSSETAVGAAGTAIAIALVPPLCVVGFGLGTRDGRIASGALMLFVANLSAILLVAMLVFVILGFSGAGAAAESAPAAPEDGQARPVDRVAASLSRLFGHPGSVTLRIAMPACLLLLVYLPLRRALGEVSWEVRTRAAIQRALRRLPLAQDAVRSTVTVERSAVRVGLVVVGGPEHVAALERQLTVEIAGAAGVQPVVQVTAVPDVDRLREMTEVLRPAAVAAVPARTPLAVLDDRLSTALAAIWPGGDAGRLVHWKVERGNEGQENEPVVTVVHVGSPVGASGDRLLGELLSMKIGAAVTVRSVNLPAELADDGIVPSDPWLLKALSAIDRASAVAALHVCLATPARTNGSDSRPAIRRMPPRRAPVVPHAALRSRLLLELAMARLPPERAAVSVGGQWLLRVAASPCAGVPEAASTSP